MNTSTSKKCPVRRNRQGREVNSQIVVVINTKKSSLNEATTEVPAVEVDHRMTSPLSRTVKDRKKVFKKGRQSKCDKQPLSFQ